MSKTTKCKTKWYKPNRVMPLAVNVQFLIEVELERWIIRASHKLPDDERALSVGRSSTCDITIVDDLVSKHHCLLRRIGEVFVVTDLGSTNGTNLNGNKVEAHGHGNLPANGYLLVGETVLLPADSKCRPFLAVSSQRGFRRYAAHFLKRDYQAMSEVYGIHRHTARRWASEGSSSK